MDAETRGLRVRQPVERDDVEVMATETTTLLGSESGSSTLPDESGPTVGKLRGFAIVLSTWALIFLQASNMSGVTMVQSAIAEELETYTDAMWFTTAYLISTSALSPIVGRLTTIFALRSLCLPISFFFVAGGLVTAAARSFWVFILGRVLTGVAGAGIMTLAIVLVLQLTGKERRGVFIGLVNCGFTIGLSTGAIVFGALLPVTGWRLLFGLQAPVALLAGVGLFFSIPSTINSANKDDAASVREKIARIDYAGAFMLVVAIVLFLYGLSGDLEWIPLVLSVAGFFIFLLIEVFVAVDPIIPLSLLSSKGVLLSCLAQLGFMSARWTLLFYTPVFVLAVRNYAPAVAGSILVPTNVGFGAGGLIVGWLHVRRNGAFWLPSIVGLVLFGITLVALAMVGTTSAPDWAFVLVVFFNGLATGASLNYTLAHVLHLSPPSQHFIATSLVGTFRGFGGSFGTAIGGGIFYRLLRGGLTQGFKGLKGGLTKEREALIVRLLGSPASVFHGNLSETERAVAIEGYAAAARGTWQAAAVLTVAVVIIQAATGWRSPSEKRAEHAEAQAGGHEEDAMTRS